MYSHIPANNVIKNVLFNKRHIDCLLVKSNKPEFTFKKLFFSKSRSMHLYSNNIQRFHGSFVYGATSAK